MIPRVSVIVPTRNAEPWLGVTLDSIRRQSYPDIELVVVDNYSDDRTREIARRFTDAVITAGPERSAQFNIGMQVASGKYVYRVDQDFVLEPSLIEEAVTTAEDRKLDAVLIHNRSDPSLGRWAQARHLEREMYRGDNLNVAARFIRRDVCLSLGGLDEDLVTGEDYDLQHRLVASGAAIDWIEAHETHRGEPVSLREVARKHFAYGKHASTYVAKYGRHAVYQLSPLRPAFLRHWRTLASHPFITLLLIIYLSVKYTAGLAGYLSSRLAHRERVV